MVEITCSSEHYLFTYYNKLRFSYDLSLEEAYCQVIASGTISSQMRGTFCGSYGNSHHF